MPKYAYGCKICGATTVEARPVMKRSEPTTCARCGSPASFQFGASFQIIANRECDRPENKYALGFSESERLQTMKADDREYEANWAGADTSIRHTTPEQALSRSPLNAIFPHA